MTFDLKDQLIAPILCTEVMQQISDHMALNYPEIKLVIMHSEQEDD